LAGLRRPSRVSVPTAIEGLPGKWRTDGRFAHVDAAGLVLDGDPLNGTASAGVAEAVHWEVVGCHVANPPAEVRDEWSADEVALG
jgi:hypothetical protein